MIKIKKRIWENIDTTDTAEDPQLDAKQKSKTNKGKLENTF